MNRIIKVFLVLVAAFASLFAICNEVFAQVVINEVYPNPPGSSESGEFIELYNRGSDAIGITGWMISDTAGSIKTYMIPPNILAAGSYISFPRSITSIILNNDGDGVVLKDTAASIIDSMSFGNSTEGYSWSRVPDGLGSFVSYTLPTEASPNPTPSPSPSPKPTPTPSPEPTIQPTSSPTPTKSPSPSPSPTKTPSPKPSPTKSPPPSTQPSGSVLGSEDIKTPVASPASQEVSENSSPVLAFGLVGAGVVLMAFSGYLAFKKQKETLPQNTI